MNPKRRQRLAVVVGLVALAAIAIGLTLYALRANIDLFFTPQQIAAGEAPEGRSLRAGGVVRFDSVRRDPERVAVSFVVTDFVDDVEVRYQGILPDLFREGQGVVVVGTLDRHGVIEASQVLAKHDENYTPPEVIKALEAGGRMSVEYRLQLDAGLAPQAIQSAAQLSGLDTSLGD
ncbi:cytochrome c maturation protein CcmE [Halotalea alkalilenta]|uniref:cytochrome c maturation protein CcmE n=1 Tax=Halotalea alkalilenta TaxID=376489 RepID=UPI000484AA8D|nr:cytochrome c maturation protein CcmE [Halotalea alkalilenta]